MLKRFIYRAGLLLFAGLMTGCSDSADVTVKESEAVGCADYMAPFQGEWISSDPDAILRVDGILIRLRCSSSHESEVFRINAKVINVDQALQKISIEGDKTPWFYHLDAEMGQLFLRINGESIFKQREMSFTRKS